MLSESFPPSSYIKLCEIISELVMFSLQYYHSHQCEALLLCLNGNLAEPEPNKTIQMYSLFENDVWQTDSIHASSMHASSLSTRYGL